MTLANIIKILSTYPLDPALLDKVSRERSGHPIWQRQSLEFTTSSFIETTPLQEIAVQSKILALGNTSLIAIFTSAHGVEAVFSLLSHKPDWTVYCLSGKTKNTILKYLPAEAILATADDGETLGEKIVSLTGHQPPKDLFFFCGNIRMPSLPGILEANKIPLAEIIVYTTRLMPVKTTEAYRGVLFFSPSAVKSYFSLNKFSVNMAAFSIGHTTSAAIRQYTDQPILTTQRPSAELVLNMVYDYFENLKT